MKYPTQSPFNLETELDISANDKILKNPFYIALKNSVIPTFPPLFSESHSPLRDLDPKSVCPPITIVCSKYYFSVTFQHICHKGSNKPPFKDISIFIEILQFIPETFIVFHEFFYDKILIVENQVIHNLLCCHCI